MNPRAKSVKPLSQFVLEVEFTNGEVRRFDVSPLLKFPVYQPLQNRIYFEKVFVTQGIVQWPNEEDISPDLLYLDSQKSA
ncbi:MAG: DUF2442 domain-containing protein [Bdellovibrionaceae bacterium]|nr:DUF2442 domain-containing protein [Pseudobdellovibrionaceae bacterium]